MMIKNQLKILKESIPDEVTLVAVSKTKPNTAILEAYEVGQRDFGENKVQEMVAKYEVLPKDIKWHMIGHLQRNKIKYMAHFVHLIHAVDSLKLLLEIDKQAKKHQRIINCLLQIRIAQEDTKFGLPMTEITNLLASDEFKQLEHIKIVGLMGMASFTDDFDQVRKEFKALKEFYTTLDKLPATNNFKLDTISMGMSGDYKIAIEEGSSMIRVGSAIFGVRNYIA